MVVALACGGRDAPRPDPSPAARATGLGPIAFGTPLDEAVDGLRNRLGDPDEETAWESAVASQFGVCPGERVRGVRWGRTWALFAEGSTRYGEESPHLFAWDAAEWFGEGFAPRTAAGIGVGSTVAELRDTYDSVETFPPEGPFPARFRVELDDGTIHGSLSDTGPDGRVTFLTAGQSCGE